MGIIELVSNHYHYANNTTVQVVLGQEPDIPGPAYFTRERVTRFGSAPYEHTGHYNMSLDAAHADYRARVDRLAQHCSILGKGVWGDGVTA